MGKIVDEEFLRQVGWTPIGNTWYPPEASHDRKYETPLMFWCRVDGTLRICGSQWASANDISVSKFLLVCSALDVTIPDLDAQFIPEGHHIVEDGDGARFVKNQ